MRRASLPRIALRLALRSWPPRTALRPLHARVARRVPAIERVMRRLASVQLHRAATLHLRVQALLAGGRMQHTERIERQLLRAAAPAVPVLRGHEKTLRIERVRHQRLLVLRTTRTEAPAPAALRPSVLMRVEHRHAAPRLQMTLARTQPAPAQAAAAEHGGKATTSARLAPSQPRSASPAAPLVLPPQELSRLTEHVIGQLDQRVRSWQERTGRL